MLQVKNLSKIYKTKKGSDVKALDDVSLNFDDSGLVFLLGKSGSGKSTLLNICGGLDSPTKGEVIVKGRSSKNFKQSDFDSYRNTFIGFIFQEYNILSEFTVEENIALALELQGKPKDKAAIAALLEQVDLTGFAKRKPNTLSGGQKQRIAIARALIKAPEVIMADEPTGALDSNTGKQVFETLKKLSRDKLVIVVSHDREFAEEYGDRIIELKDGKVISDVSKVKEQQIPLSANLNAVSNVLCIKNGAALTDDDFEKVKAFLRKSKSDIVIASDDKDVENFKKVSRINDDGTKEVFSNTGDIDVPTYSKEDSRFIRSKLPLRHAVKIGLSSLKSKPFRLLITMLLCTAAFAMFGLLSTMSFYDSRSTFDETMASTNESIIKLNKDYEATVLTYTNGIEEDSYTYIMDGRFNDAELDEFRAIYGNDAFGAVNSYSAYGVRSVPSRYWVTDIALFAYLPDGNSLRQNINGEYPDNDNEIAISSYGAEVLYNCGTYDNEGKNIELGSPADIIGKKINISGHEYTVTGIVDSGAVDPKYDFIINGDATDRQINEYSEYLTDGIALMAFVSDDRLEEISDQNIYRGDSIYNYTQAGLFMSFGAEVEYLDYGNVFYKKASEHDLSDEYIAWSGTEIASDDEVIVTSRVFGELVSSAISELYETLDYNDYEQVEKVSRLSTLSSSLYSGMIWEYPNDGGEPIEKKLTESEIYANAKELVECLKEMEITPSLGLKLYNAYSGSAMGDGEAMKLTGIVMSYGDDLSSWDVYLSDGKVDALWETQKVVVEYFSETTSEYADPEDAVYTDVILDYTYTEEAVNDLWRIFSSNSFNENGYRIVFGSSFISKLSMVDQTVKELSKVFLIVGIVTAAFSVLLFSNFISASIAQKTKEIGILRAVGARGTDVFKIFFSESAFIAFVCIGLSTIASIIGCRAINDSLAEGLGANLLVFGVMSLVSLIAAGVVTALVSTFLPVYNAARKKPVDSIRSL